MRKFLLLTLVFVSSILSANAQVQEQNPPETYRIVAVSQSDSAITSTSNEVRLYLPMKLYVPSAFTPNNDGLNDHFGAVGEGVEAYELMIFNRWGELIFTSQHIDHKWDGTHDGQLAPVGTYTFEVVAYGKERGRIHKTGYVSLIN